MTNDHETPRFTIVGSGLAGALLACYLGREGYRVDLYEKRSDPRGQDQPQGRSINLAISVRGIEALRAVGLADAVLRAAIPMRGRMIHARTGARRFQPYGKSGADAIHSVSRSGLNIILLETAANYPSVRLFFQQRCTGVDLKTGTVELTGEGTHTVSRVESEVVIGADGAYSAVRNRMQHREGFDYHQEYLSHGYKELTMPAGPGGAFALEKHALHIWPRHSFMLIALPNLDGSFTCTLFYPLKGPNSFQSLHDEAEVRRFFQAEFPDALERMPNLAEDFFKHPTGALVTLRCRPWHVHGKVMLIGDAAHAVVPFLGQGMNAAFEDCTVLHECLARKKPDWEAAFQDYEALRKENTDVLANLCIQNFVEMRDLVGSRVFLFKKKLEITLSKLFPGWYVPLYTMVSFTRIPYAEALRRARRQDRVVRILGGMLILALCVLAWVLSGCVACGARMFADAAG